ncbi:hypothetical protein KSP39_PZI005930 [Platanthera zijinensis]|uniref:Uncharacterized protein n=1 Tax=Platanthera zijinensis TaxID=2320716 RepID=A0AAP0BU26_9ASPA
MMIDRMSSIEKEPRTLSIDQIRNAREEALYVMKTKTVEEALSLFTQLMPVKRSVRYLIPSGNCPYSRSDDHGRPGKTTSGLCLGERIWAMKSESNWAGTADVMTLIHRKPNPNHSTQARE